MRGNTIPTAVAEIMVSMTPMLFPVALPYNEPNVMTGITTVTNINNDVVNVVVLVGYASCLPWCFINILFSAYPIY